MLDFTSALYLGLRHPSAVPRAMGPTHERAAGCITHDSESRMLAQALANLVGCARATLGSSTLHLFWDLFGMLDRRQAIYMDAGVYPIGRWGVERAAARGIFLYKFFRITTAELCGARCNKAPDRGCGR